jgi:molybdopterin synthase catalytic subunit
LLFLRIDGRKPDRRRTMVEEWMEEIRKSVSPDMLGMMLVHNGVVRASSKQGTAVKGMRLTYDRSLLAAAIDEAKGHEGIADVKVWINEGDLNIGDDIMYVLVAGRFRTDVLPVLQGLLSNIKGEVVHEEEVLA